MSAAAAKSGRVWRRESRRTRERAVRVSEDKHEQTDTRAGACLSKKRATGNILPGRPWSTVVASWLRVASVTDLGDYIEGHATNRSRARALILA